MDAIAKKHMAAEKLVSDRKRAEGGLNKERVLLEKKVKKAKAEVDKKVWRCNLMRSVHPVFWIGCSAVRVC